MAPKKILVVEDEFITGADLQRRLSKAGFDVPVVADTGNKAIAYAGEHRPDLVLMDITLKGAMTGIEAAAEIAKVYDIPVIFLTAHTDDATVNEAVRSQPFGYLVKPVDDRALKTTIQMALFKHTMELRLRASEEQYRTIASLVDESIYIVDRDRIVIYLNQCAADIIGRDPASSIGKPLTALLPEEAGRALDAALDSVFASGKPFRKTSRFVFEKSELWLDTSLIPFRSEEGGIISVLGISRDITGRVLLEQQMEQEGLSRIEKNMEEFQVLNDQIRNPLQIIAALTTLDNGPNTKKVLDQIAIINGLVDRLDKGWVESEKVRSFLLRHYGHGGMIRNDDTK